VDTNGSHDDATYRTYSRFGNPWMWTGQRHDAATGTYHFTGRTLSTNLGRWLQRDPLGYVDGVNLNEYCGGSPVRFVDPMGFGLWEYIVGADGPEATRAFFGSLWGDAKDTAADVYGGVEAIVTGVPGASDAVSDGIDAIVDANAQRILGKWENANNSGEIGYGEAAWELGKDIVGADPLAEGLSGVDLATGSRISTLDSQQRTLNGISGLTGTAAALSGGITSTLEGSGTGCASNAKPPRAPIETPKTPAPKAPVPKAPPPNGPRLYRVFGGEAKGLGQYYTTTNPGSVPNYRVAAGLYPGNTGQFILEGFLSNSEGVMFRTAASGPGGIGGGLPEVFVPNPHAQINIVRVSGVNPPF
jgi:RHS repeat-associated protein